MNEVFCSWKWSSNSWSNVWYLLAGAFFLLQVQRCHFLPLHKTTRLTSPLCNMDLHQYEHMQESQVHVSSAAIITECFKWHSNAFMSYVKLSSWKLCSCDEIQLLPRSLLHLYFRYGVTGCPIFIIPGCPELSGSSVSCQEAFCILLLRDIAECSLWMSSV